MKSLAEGYLGASGKEGFTLTNKLEKIKADKLGNMHIRFKEVIHGITVDGGAIVVHIRKDGTIFAINGEFVNAKDVPSSQPQLDAETALEAAMAELGVEGEWLDEPALTIVHGDDEKGHLAWKNTLAYSDPTSNGPMQKMSCLPVL